MASFVKSINFWLVFGLFASVFFVVAINFEQLYQVKTDVLFLSKNKLAAEQIDITMENLQQIINSPSFYQSLSTSYGLISTSDKFDYSRYWTAKMKVERIGESSVLRITVSDKERSEAERISQLAFKEITQRTSQYYNIRTELDLRVLDESMTSITVRYGFISLFLASVVGGFLLTLLVFFLFLVQGTNDTAISKKAFRPFSLSGLEEMKKRMKTDNAILFTSSPEPTRKISHQETTAKPDAKPQPVSLPKEVESTDKPEPRRLPTLKAFSPIKKSAAPGSLPLAEEDDIRELKETLYPSQFKKKPSVGSDEIAPCQTTSVESSEIPEEILKEPTAEEVKQRLNRLIKGKF